LDLKEYIDKQIADPEQNEIFASILELSEPGGEVYEYPSIKNAQLLNDFLDIVGLELPEGLREDFRIFYVPGVDCPCILYNGEINLDEFKEFRGINYTNVLFKTSSGFFADASTKELPRRYIFVKGGGNTKENIDIIAFHEIIHLYNSFRFKNLVNTSLNHIYRYFLDEVNAYFLANNTFPDINRFYYLKNNGNETLVNPTLKRKEEIDTFANIYFSFYKAFRKGGEFLDLLINTLIDTVPDATLAYIDIQDSPFEFSTETDLKMLYSFTKNLFQYNLHTGEIISNNKLIFAEQLTLWALKQFHNDEVSLENKANNTSFFNIINNLDNLYSIELTAVNPSMYSHVLARQRNIINKELLPLIPEDSQSKFYQLFKIQLNDEYLNKYHPDNMKELDDLIEFSIQLANDSTVELKLRKQAIKFLESEIDGDDELISVQSLRSQMRILQKEMMGQEA
jgi:hypothetical protein